MSDYYPNQQEIAFALENLQRHERTLDVHERLILRNFKNMAIDEQKQVLSHLLERAQNYNNSMIAVGYTAFFAAWAFFQNQYQSAWYDTSMLMMLVSVMFFVVWNVFSNIIVGNDLFHKAEIIYRNIHDPVYLFEVISSYDKDLLERAMRRKLWWHLSLYFTIIPAFVAAFIFFSVIGSGIIRRLI